MKICNLCCLIALGPNLYHGCILGVAWLNSKMDDIDLFFEVMGSISTWKFAIFTYKLDNLTNISCIGSKLIPWMYSRSVLVKFKDGWPWLVFRGHAGWFHHGNLQFSLVNTITQQILVALGPNLNHGCILRVSRLSSKMDDLDLFFLVLGFDFNMQICNLCL